MARRRGGFRKGTKRPVGWVRSFIDEQVVDDTPTVLFTLLEGPDWAVGTMNEMATVRRIRLAMIVVPGIEIIQGLVYWAIYVSDRDAVGVRPDAVAILDENILSLGIFGHGARGSSGSFPLPTGQLDVDVKAMRKVRDDEVVNLVMTTDAAATAVTVSGYTSVLMSRGQS